MGGYNDNSSLSCVTSYELYKSDVFLESAGSIWFILPYSGIVLSDTILHKTRTWYTLEFLPFSSTCNAKSGHITPGEMNEKGLKYEHVESHEKMSHHFQEGIMKSYYII